jgi:engulfment/cell motility protein 1
LTDNVIDRILHLLIIAPQLNVLRPCTAIVRKLIVSSPQVNGKKKDKGKGKGKPLPFVMEDGRRTTVEADRFGFDRMWQRMSGVGRDEEGVRGGQEGLLSVVVKRLEGTSDLELVAQRLAFSSMILRGSEADVDTALA